MSVNYFVIGSYYYWEDKPGEDMLDDMMSHNVMSVGWGMEAGLDLTNLYGKKSPGEITDYLKNKGLSIKSYSNLKRFLSLKPGDIVAIKKWDMRDGNGSIIVRAYARVVRRQGSIYHFDKASLGHMMNAEYLKKNVSNKFPYNYSQAIHQVTKPDRIRIIFGPVL